jgi:hypothetical protein
MATKSPFTFAIVRIIETRKPGKLRWAMCVDKRRKTHANWILVRKLQGKYRVDGVGASNGNLPHVVNFGDQVTLMQIGIQVTAR